MSDALDVRSFVVNFLRQELVGPAPGFPAMQLDGEEILRPQDPPRQRYGAGILFPLKALAEVENTEEEREIEADAGAPDDQGPPEGNIGQPGERNRDEVPPETDQEVRKANEFLPSAMGISCLVELPPTLIIEVQAAWYDHQPLPGWERENKDGKLETQKGWWRKPLHIDVEFPAADLISNETVVRSKKAIGDEDGEGLWVHIVSRPHDRKKPEIRLLTATLINRVRSSGAAPRNEECYYQCGLKVKGAENNLCFLEYPDRPVNDLNEEEKSLRLLYRHRHIFGVGHGCSADWSEPDGCRTNEVRTEVLPEYEIRPVLPTQISGLSLSMYRLATEAKADSLETCRRLASSYEDWIGQERASVAADSNLAPLLEKTALSHLDRCDQCLGRIRAGIDLLETADDAWAAFLLMNRAMLHQQLHYPLASRLVRHWVPDGDALVLEKPYSAPDHTDVNREWRPFQLAFVLMNITSMVRQKDPERSIVDLIWFPTGGGKTEAYLGLTAFTLFLRRIRNRNDAGTTALMRYTLRLLTTQQYQRAASLICACELLRRDDPEVLGDEPISIGLWVGGDVTPNKDDQAVEALNNLLRGQGDNRFIVVSCPWCGAEMGPVTHRKTFAKGYERVSNPKTVRFRCEDPDCEFHDDRGLPLHVIDQRIYETQPTLIVGTVDKFAMLPWLPQARALFGIHPERPVSPPDLVIQDELHLISGPLGSMVGHYETVIDELTNRVSEDGSVIPAKIVASTATISRAYEQIHHLYGREGFLFPPQALKAGDSFFAEEREDAVGRLYVGVLASALPSHVTAQVRAMSALLQAVKLAPGAPPEAIDPYWTMMGYFNSLRELGHAATLIRADIREYLNAVWDRMGITADMGGEDAKKLRRFINRDVELTSRVPSSRIPSILLELFDEFRADSSSDAVDVCFATNMIQVGLDVSRLSLMTIVGQPKTTAEYIQASSRVGRDKERPGLVVTNYNPFKPRDRSHFEHFRAYHESIYRFVEPTSVTPFAIPVRERALHALMVTLARYWGGEALRDRPQIPPDATLKQRIEDVIERRVKNIAPDETAGTMDLLDELFEEWDSRQPSKIRRVRPTGRGNAAHVSGGLPAS